MLVVRRWRAISSASIHQMSKVEDGTSGPEEGSAQYRDSMAETTGKEVVSRTASEREGSRTTTVIFKKYGSG